MSGLRSHNEFDSLETFFNSRLKDASLEPTDNSWMLIEEELNRLAKEKRRRRFLWFFSSGVVLTCGLVSLFYLLNGNQWALTGGSTQSAVNSKQSVVNSQSAVDSKQEAAAGGSEQPGTNTEQPNTKQDPDGYREAVTSEKTEHSSTQKIQLGAFKHKANVAAFNKIPYKVIEVNSNDGYTKYYAESDEKDALERVQQAGFAGAFLKKDFDESLEKSVVKNEGVVESSEPVYYASNSLPNEEKVKSTTAQVFAAVSHSVKKEPIAVATESKARKNEPQDLRPKTQYVSKENKQPETIAAAESKKENSFTTNESKTENSTPVAVINPEIKKEEPVKENNAAPNETKQPETVAANTKPETVGSTKSAVSSEQPQEVITQTNTEQQNTKPETVGSIKSAVSSEQPQEVITQTNTEQQNSKPEMSEASSPSGASLLTKEQGTAVSIDSNKTNPFKPIWSLSFIGGPNFFNTNSQSSSVKTLNEHQNMTYNGEVKLQFQPMKFLSISAGVNYNTFTAQQDATYFRFYKYQTEDYQFHSSFGSMAVPMSVMLQGFYMSAPIDTFFSKYSYTTTLQTINIPLQANVHFLNSKWVNLSLGVGANSSYAIGQHTHFSLIKENSTVEYNYNNVTANKFNLLLMASLGCDIRITKHWYVTINPSYRYGLTNFSSVSGTTYKPAFFSANGGVKFQF